MSIFWKARLTLVFAMFATTYAAHSAITHIRGHDDWRAAFDIALALVSVGVLTTFVMQTDFWKRKP
jgi:hypothetical protein